MDYKLIWHKSALDDLKSLDISISKKIFEKVEKYLSKDPIRLGKPLKQNFAGMYRYRYGDYRIIYILNTTEKIITILEIGHRKNIYKK